ncbi:unnamed protein product [Allacma fusca]|uniref:Uncharacterized protein n=1 Tax=Allacma fusca TaxID=39272 RepID=A0A8J2K8N0_9HEXA|nr:unnamed protein product [Allacma fusca]
MRRSSVHQADSEQLPDSKANSNKPDSDDSTSYGHEETSDGETFITFLNILQGISSYSENLLPAALRTEYGRGRSKFAVILDEGIFVVDDCNREPAIFYTTEDIFSDTLTLEKRERFGGKMMVAGAMSGVGVLLLIRVPPKVKVNAQYYMDQVLRPLFEDGIAQLYDEDSAKVFVHHNAARSHTGRLTEQYAKDLQDRTKITIIKNTEIPTKSPDASSNFARYGTKELLKNVSKLLGPGNDASVPYQKKMGNT